MSCTERQRPVVPRADDSVFSVEITLALVSTFLIHQSDWIPPHEAVEAYEHVFGSGYGLNRQIEIQNIAVVYYAGPRAWNKLPSPLRRVYSPATFKRQVKTFVYNHAFNSHC